MTVYVMEIVCSAILFAAALICISPSWTFRCWKLDSKEPPSHCRAFPFVGHAFQIFRYGSTYFERLR